MKMLQSLVREIHRRSVWQVLSVYMAGSWVVIRLVEAMTEAAGLPTWTPALAFVLLLVGLPVTVATAFVQGGLPGRTAPTAADPEAEAARILAEVSIEGLTPQQVHRVPRRHPLVSTKVFTWRNATLGGVAGAALLVGSVAAYLTMWALGIGPVGSLVAQGVIEAADRVIVAAFEDHTEDRDLGPALTEAFRVDLGQSRVLAVMDDRLVGDALGRMGRDAGTVLTPGLAREVAAREGVRAVIEGDVSQVGSGYLLTAGIALPETGSTVAAFRESAAGEDELLPAVDRLSLRLREKAGESLRDIRAGEPLEKVTTASLDALRLYTGSHEALARGDVPGTVALLEQAVELDSAFAMAWRRIAVVLSSGGVDPDRAQEAATRAYEHRDRLTEKERHLAAAFYHSEVAGDRARTIQEYEAVLRLDPDDGRALNNLAGQFETIENAEGAAELYYRAIDGPGRSDDAFQNLIRNRIAAGHVGEAREVLSRYEAASPEDAGLDELRFWVAYAEGDLGRAEAVARAQAEAAAGAPVMRAGAYDRMAGVSVTRGRLREARTRLLQSERSAAQVTPGFTHLRRLSTARADIGLGDREWGVEHVAEAVRDGAFQDLPPLARAHFMTALDLALGGRPSLALRVADDYEASYPVAARSSELDARMGLVRAVARLFEGDTAGVIQAFGDARAARECRRCYRSELAWILEQMGDAAAAVALHEDVLAHGDRPLELTPVYRTASLVRLGPLYERVGDTTRAVEAYRRLVEQWANADAGGRPALDHARARLAALGG